MKITLRNIQPVDEEFLFNVYASTRIDEMSLVAWGDSQKETFLRMQFHAQRRQYQLTYPDAINQIIEFNGIPTGRLIVDRSANETILVDIALLPDFRNLGLGTSLPLCKLYLLQEYSYS